MAIFDFRNHKSTGRDDFLGVGSRGAKTGVKAPVLAI
jgi:hypothetical protein